MRVPEKRARTLLPAFKWYDSIEIGQNQYHFWGILAENPSSD
jgi:hypothetical protein